MDKTLICNKLGEVMSNTYALYLKTQSYHWHVQDKNFHMLHAFFEEQYEDLSKAVDVLAERIRALGGYAPGTFKEISSLSKISDGDKKACAKDMLLHLKADNEKLFQLCKEVSDEAAKQEDKVSEDLLISRMQYHEHQVWMIASHVI